LVLRPSVVQITAVRVFYGLDWIATVPPTVALTAQIFGRDRVGLVFGWIFAAHQLGAAAAASFAGTLRTIEGTYDHAFLISGNLCFIAAVSILFIGIRPSRVISSEGLAVSG
jgi:MFS family permease